MNISKVPLIGTQVPIHHDAISFSTSLTSRGLAAGLCTEPPIHRILSVMVTDNTLDLVLPTDQGKHLLGSHLQGTKRDQAWLVYPIGPAVSPQGVSGRAYLSTPRHLSNCSGYPR